MPRRDRQLLDNVVRQAFASSWGDKALLALGEMALEAGDFTPPAGTGSGSCRPSRRRALPNTWPGYPDTTLDLAAVRARLVLVSILEGLGRAGRARSWRQFVRLHRDARGRLGGREVTYAAALGELAGPERAWPGPKPGPDWPTFAGSPARNRIAPEVLDVGRRGLAAAAAAAGASGGDRRVAIRCRGRRRGHAAELSSRGGRRRGCSSTIKHEILAVDAADGKPAWGDAAGDLSRADGRRGRGR